MRRWVGMALVSAAVLAVAWLVQRELSPGADEHPAVGTHPGEAGGGALDGRSDAAARPAGPELRGSGRPGAEASAADELRLREALVAEERARRSGHVVVGGRVFDAQRHAVEAAEIAFVGPSGRHATASDDEGAFHLALPPGRYDVSALAAGEGALVWSGYVVDAGARLDLELVLTPPIRLLALVERAGRGLDDVRTVLRRTGPGFAAEALEREARTDAAGRAPFADVVPGAYELRAELANGQTVRTSFEAQSGLEVRLPVEDAVELLGRVTDAATGRPVVGARIAVVTRVKRGPEMESTGLSDADGRYRLSVLRGTPSSMRVEAAGFAPWPAPARLSDVLASLRGLSTGPAAVPQDVELGVGASVVGTVRSAVSGAPLAGIALGFTLRRSSAVLVRAVTDAEGRYTAANLAATTYDVVVETPGWFPPAPLRVGVPERSDAPVELDVTLVGARAVAGTVLSGEGAPVAGARVWLTRGGRVLRSVRAGGPLEAFTGEGGRFRIADVPLEAPVEGRAAVGALQATPQTVEGPGEVSVRLTLSSTGGVVGRVTDLATGEALPGVTVRLRPDGDPPGRDRRSAASDATGAFTLEGLIPGDYRVEARREGYLPLAERTVTVAGSELRALPVPLDPGLAFAGTVFAASGAVAGADVRIVGRAEGGEAVRRETRADAEGRFRLTGFVRGEYRLRVDAAGHVRRTLEGLRGGEERLSVELSATKASGS